MAISSRALLSSSISALIALPACTGPVAGTEGTDTAPVDTTEDTTTTGTTTGTTTEVTTSTTAPTTSDATSSGSSTTDEEIPEPEVWDGAPFPWDEWGRWNWYEFPDAYCRDGSNAGVWVRFGQGPGLVIYFEAGGACFNALTCANNESYYEPWYFPYSSGLFREDAAGSPVGDWNFVFVPYCTGDVHGGVRPDVEVPGVEGLQQFVGYRNMEAFLHRIVPTFGEAPNVLVTGSSAGGFGAGINYDRIARAFPKARVTLLDDSGPPLANDVLAPCLQQQWSDLWGLDETLPAGCDDCSPSEGGGLVNLARYLAEAHPEQRFGLVSSTQDVTIRFFFGYGEDDCMPQSINIPAGDFEAGLIDLRDNYIGEPAGRWGTYYVGNSDDHVWLVGNSLKATSVDGVIFYDWIAQLLAGEAGHVGP